MSCEKFERLIALYVEGDLSDGKERRLRDHLARIFNLMFDIPTFQRP